MRVIPLTQGKVALVDDDDFAWLSQWKWLASRTDNNWYAKRSWPRPLVLMHREIMGTPAGVQTDHRNGDGLDNQRANLRIATSRQNNQNRRKGAGTTSRFKGVSWDKKLGKWQVTIGAGARTNGKARIVYVGAFFSEELAARAYDAAARKHFGEFARMNFAK